MKNKKTSIVVLTLLAGVSVSSFYYFFSHRDEKWLRDIRHSQPTGVFPQEHPYTSEAKIKMSRIMNDLPVLKEWNEKECAEIIDLLNIPYTKDVFDESKATWADVGNMAVSQQMMATISLRMTHCGPINKEVAEKLKNELVKKLNSWSSLDKKMSMASLLESGLMFRAEVRKAVEPLKKDEDPVVARLASRNISLSEQKEYIDFWREKSKIRGY